MLEDAEANVARLEGSLADPPDMPAKAVAVIPSVIAGYLKDLKGLVAVLRGNLPGILGLPLRSKWCRGRDSNPHGVSPT